MKTIKELLGLAAIVVFWTPVVYAAFFYAAAREAYKKHKLGRYYEGPLED